MSTRFHYNIKQKLQILDLAREDQWFRLYTHFPKVTKKMIDEWKEKEAEMRSLPEDTQISKFILHPGPETKYKELYQFMYQTFKDLRSENKAVTSDYLLYLAESEDSRIKELTIKGRHSLINRFMKFYSLSVREITGYSAFKEEDIPEDQQTLISDFKKRFIEIVKNKNIPASNIFNMDQTAVYYENPTSKTLEIVGTREVCALTRGGEKKRITLFSLLNAEGELFTQMLVFKGARYGRIQEEIEEYDDYTTLHTVQDSAWTDGLTLIDWIHKIWIPSGGSMRGNKLLILDSYPLHKEFEENFAIEDTEVLYVPPGLTWCLQPLDAGFHKLLKDQLKKVWTRTQHSNQLTEKQKRQILSETLKKTYEYMAMNDNSVFWDKTGLKCPPLDQSESQVQNQGDFMEIIENSDHSYNSRMEIEEENSNNLF